jgi:hypothetical protein
VENSSEGDRSKPAALQLDLPGPAPVAARPDELEQRRLSLSAAARTRARRAVVVVCVLLAAGAGAATFALPGYVRQTCIDQAAAHGIALTVEGVSLRRSGFALTGVRATSPEIPGLSAEAPEVDIETLDFHPEKLTATGMQIALDGRWDDVSAAFERWRASDQGGQGGAWAPASLVVDGSRIVWRGPIGENARVEAAGAHLDVTWKDRVPTLRATSSNVTIAVPGGTLGPWRFDIDREPGASRARIALDPAVPEACTVLIVTDQTSVTAVDVAIPRSPVARLGLTPALLGLHGNIQFEAAAHYTPFGPHTNASATARGGLYGVTVESAPRPLDVSWDLKATGNPATTQESPRGAELDVKDARIAVGPLVGAARGTLKVFEDGFRVDLGWSAGPVPCAAFDTALAPGQPFDIAYQIRKLAESTGLTRLHGDVSANALLAFDSRDLGTSSLSFTPKANCDVALGL